MKLYRFMSITECANLIKGKILVNKTDHSQKRGTASTAKGFCFGIGDKEQACKDFRHLKGIVDINILVVVDVKTEREYNFMSCQGRYIDYDKMEAEGKTLDDYPAFDKPHKMLDEYCTKVYSSNDFEEYHVYGVFYDITKDPSGTDCLKLQEISIEKFLEGLTDDGDWDKGLSLSKEIINLLHKHKDIRAGETMIALAAATSYVFDVIVDNTNTAPQRCFDDFVDMLKCFTFSDKEK